MSVEAHLAQRLRFLARIVHKECQHLSTTDQRIFATPFTVVRANQLEMDPELAERVEAFVGRFGRLQYTAGDKLPPALLTALGERPSATIDNLDRAERLGLIDSTDDWMTMRNKMVHDMLKTPHCSPMSCRQGTSLSRRSSPPRKR